MFNTPNLLKKSVIIVNGSSTKENLNRIMNYKCPLLVQKIMGKLNITKEKADILFLETKRFLYICGTFPGKWSPSPQIDECWHEFILFMRDYESFCMEFFGRVLYHVPNDPSERPDKSRPRRTLVAAMTIFGKEHLSSSWTYTNKKGESVLTPHTSIEQMQDLDAFDPCRDSCGCDAACNDD